MEEIVQQYRNLLKETDEILKIHEQEWKKSGKYFNVFSAIGIERKEIRHSALLASFLDPNGFHGMSDLFLKEFLNRIDFTHFPVKDARVFTEEVISNNRRLDIDICSKDGKYKVVIENKIYTSDHDQQLNAYLEDLKKQKLTDYKLVYLTLYGEKPIEDIKEDETHLICLSYKDDIIQIIDSVSSINNLLPQPVLEIMRQYSLTLKNLTNQGVDKNMNEELIQLLLEGNYFQLAEELSKQIEPLKIQILTSFLTLLKQKFESNKHKVEISENSPEKAARKYITSKNSWINLNISLESGKTFILQFADLDEIWQIIENDPENTEKLNKISTVTDFKPLFIKFKSPNDEFKTFAKMNDTEREKYVSDYVGDIEARLKNLNL